MAQFCRQNKLELRMVRSWIAYLYESATFEETYIVKNTEYGHEIMKRINEENSDFENETGTDMIDVLEDDEIVINDD